MLSFIVAFYVVKIWMSIPYILDFKPFPIIIIASALQFSLGFYKYWTILDWMCTCNDIYNFLNLFSQSYNWPLTARSQLLSWDTQHNFSHRVLAVAHYRCWPAAWALNTIWSYWNKKGTWMSSVYPHRSQYQNCGGLYVTLHCFHFWSYLAWSTCVHTRRDWWLTLWWKNWTHPWFPV